PEIRFAAVVRIDKAEVQPLAALVDVGNAGRRELDDRLGETVDQSCADERPQCAMKVGKKGMVGRRKQLFRIGDYGLFVGLADGAPVGPEFRFAQSLFDEGDKTLLQSLQAASVLRLQVRRPDPGKRLVEH